MTQPPITAAMQTSAWLMAHRTILTVLVKLVQTLPGEGSAKARDATATLCHNTLQQLFINDPEPMRRMLITLAQQEVDRIFIASVQEAPPAAD